MAFEGAVLTSYVQSSCPHGTNTQNNPSYKDSILPIRPLYNPIYNYPQNNKLANNLRNLSSRPRKALTGRFKQLRKYILKSQGGNLSEGSQVDDFLV